MFKNTRRFVWNQTGFLQKPALYCRKRRNTGLYPAFAKILRRSSHPIWTNYNTEIWRQHAYSDDVGHQSNRKGKKKWWFSVYRDPENKVAQFAFVDLGIGIFVSLERRKIPWVMDVIAKQGSENRAGILKELLTNQTTDNGLPAKKRTSTKKAHRGKGLPNIARRNREKQTRRLRIINN